jgi:hypothetical protein
MVWTVCREWWVVLHDVCMVQEGEHCEGTPCSCCDFFRNSNTYLGAIEKACSTSEDDEKKSDASRKDDNADDIE